MHNFDLTDEFAARAALPEKGQRDYWDSTLAGFGLRVSAGGARTWQLVYRYEGRKRRLSLGPLSKLSAAPARKLAIKKLGAVMNGSDPAQAKKVARQTPTIRTLATEYLAEAQARGKRSWSEDQGLFRTLGVLSYKDGSFSPLARFKLGETKVSIVTGDHIKAIHSALNDTPYRANRARALLSVIFNRAIQSKWRTDNPCTFVQRYHEEKRERFLNVEELNRLVQVLDSSSNQDTANAVRLLILTGSRRGEVLKARWSEIDLDGGVWTRPSAHTKQKKVSRIPLNSIAIEVLKKMRLNDPEAELLFPGTTGAPLVDIKRFWRNIRKQAGLPDVRLHDLRHSFASMLIARGLTLPVIGKLMGHSNAQTTERYAHLLDGPLRAATDSFAKALKDATTAA
jgi:integrase